MTSFYNQQNDQVTQQNHVISLKSSLKLQNITLCEFDFICEINRQKFVILFQTIQIQRLFQHLQVFQSEMEDSDFQISKRFNMKVKEQISNKCKAQQISSNQSNRKICTKCMGIFMIRYEWIVVIDFYFFAKQIGVQINQKINKNNLFGMLSQQIVQLNNDINEARASPNKYNGQISFQQFQARLVRLEQQSSRGENLFEKLHEYQNQIQRMSQVIESKNRQLQSWRIRHRKLQSNYSQANTLNGNSVTGISQSRLRHAEQERQRAQEELKFKGSQIEEWKAKCISLQRAVNNYKVIQKQKRGLEQQLHYQIRISDDYERKIRYLEDAASHLHQLENQLKNEQSRRMQYIQQIQRLNGIIQIKSLESQNMSRKILSLQEQIRGLKSVQRQLFDEKLKIQHISDQLVRLNKAVSQKATIIISLKQQFGKKSLNNSQKDEVKRLLDANMKQINDLFEKLEESNKQNDQLQLQIMGANNQISGLKTEINLMKQEKQSVNVIYYQKSQQCENYKKQMNARIEEIRELRKFESATYQYQAKMKNLEQNYIDIERRYKKECYKTEELYRLHSNAKSDIDKIKRDGYIPADFMNQFTVLKKNFQAKQKELKDIQNRCLAAEKGLKSMKKLIAQQNQMAKTNNQKWLNVGKGLQEFKNFAKNALQYHDELSKAKEDNMYLESSKRLMTFELTCSKNILSKSYVQQSESITSQTQKFSPDGTKMSTQISTIGSSIKRNIIMRKSAIESSGGYQYRSQYQSKFVNQSFK